jgi:hypothetical protein
MKASALVVPVAIAAAAVFSAVAVAMPDDFGAWSAATRVEAAPGTDPSFNGAALDGCPFISRDGKTFYMASNRAGGLGGIDIWVSTRTSVGDPWGAPVNVGEPVNSSANDFCPTIDRDGHAFYFVSNRGGGCGGDDIYSTRLRPDGWDPVVNLGCDVNSSANEASPMPLPERGSGPVLYFSSNRAGGFSAEAPGTVSGDSDLYVSGSQGGVFGVAELVLGANSAAEDGQPNVRRDGLELFFFSTRPGTLGMADIFAATRASTSDVWSTPFNLGSGVNSAVGAETRPSLSWDGTTLYFGSTRPGGEGMADHYVTTRERVVG